MSTNWRLYSMVGHLYSFDKSERARRPLKKASAITLVLLCLAIGMPASWLHAQAYSYKFRYLTVDEGLSHTDANDIVQDKDGFIWVATYFGLSRFDGYTVKRYYNTNSPLNNALKNRIMTILPDDSGKLWLGTEDGLQLFHSTDGRYEDIVKDSKPSSFVSRLLKGTRGRLYGIAQGRLVEYDSSQNGLQEKKIEAPADIEFTSLALSTSGVVYVSSNDGLWTLGEDQGLTRLPLSNLAIRQLSFVGFNKQNALIVAGENKVYRFSGHAPIKQHNISDTLNLFTLEAQFTCPRISTVKNVIREPAGNYWISTSTDVLQIDSNFNFKQAINKKSSLYSLNSTSINKIFVDASGCLWVCTFGGGVNFCDLHEKPFFTLQHNPEQPNSLSGNHIRSVLEDGDILWIGTTANGLNAFNIKTGHFTFYNKRDGKQRLKDDAVSALAMDKQNNLWIGTGSGIEVLKDRKSIWHPPGQDKFPTYPIETLAVDCYGNIWFGNHVNQFGVIVKDTTNSYHVKYYGEGYYIAAQIDKPQLFISSTHGLKRAIIDKEGNITKMFTYQAGQEGAGLSSNYTYPIRQQNDTTWWVGMIGGGLDRLTLLPKNESVIVKWYRNNLGVFNDVESLEIGTDGNVWLGGNGLERLNPITGKLTKYDKNDGLQGNSFKVNASAAGASGRLYFGGINGLNYFFPDQINSNPISARPFVTDIVINNGQQYGENLASSEIAQSVTYRYDHNLILNYLQNNFVISFSAMHFANPLKCLYRYKLLGFDKDWKYTDGQSPRAAYSNLDYDQYTFVLQASNNDGVWSRDQTTVSITLRPPWWKSPLAKIVYVLLVVAALSGVYIYQGRWHRLKRELEIRAVNEQRMAQVHREREELYQQQLTFFTNISHEFRTPLTLIVGPLETIMGTHPDPKFDTFFQLMYRNAKRLTNLINELMNFRKVTDNFIKLRVRRVDIGDLAAEVASSFRELAKGKQVEFHANINRPAGDSAPVLGFLDIQVVEKILFNLLHNAFKYTDPRGTVSFELFHNLDKIQPIFEPSFQVLHQQRFEQYVYFRIADTGTGISSESLKNIFDRYYRVNTNHLGSGVGLSLVKSLTELHKGDIYVRSERHRGTEIIIGLPCGPNDYATTEFDREVAEVLPQLEKIDTSTLLPFIEQTTNEAATGVKLDRHILVVEDNDELRLFLRKNLETFYHVHEAVDGFAGLALAIEAVPDLIISDVIMPGMDGIALCSTIKEKFETSHIPFIILSAKEALDAKLAGMASGADYYFSKPLNTDLLLLTIHNLFEQNKRLKLKYVNDYLSEATDLVSSKKDREFLSQLTELIQENIEDSALDASFLCERLFISRTKLYQKVKSLTDQSVADFIRIIRLKKAVYIMTHENVSINEVADRIGMLSASNFSRTFKKEYGKSPLQFIQSLKRNES